MTNKKHIINYGVLSILILIMEIDNKTIFLTGILLLIGMYFENSKKNIKPKKLLMSGIFVVLMGIFLKLASNLPENTFILTGICSFSLKGILNNYFLFEEEISIKEKVNVSLIWLYTILLSIESIGIFGYLGYKFFFR